MAGNHTLEFSDQNFEQDVLESAQPVLVDFWATWCQPCKQEMPGYQKLLDRYGAQGLSVVGFKFDTMMDTEEPLKFAKKMGIRYPLAVATGDLKQKFGGIEGLPCGHTVLLPSLSWVSSPAGSPACS